MASTNNERDGSSPGRATKRLRRSIAPVADEGGSGVIATLSPELWAGVLECELRYLHLFANICARDM